MVDEDLLDGPVDEGPSVVAVALASGKWVKSSRSTGNCACVEIHESRNREFVLIRDSKFRRNPANAGSPEPLISVSSAVFAGFLNDVARNDGVWLNGVLIVSQSSDGAVVLRSGEAVALHYTSDEWEAFRAGVVALEFEFART